MNRLTGLGFVLWWCASVGCSPQQVAPSASAQPAAASPGNGSTTATASAGQASDAAESASTAPSGQVAAPGAPVEMVRVDGGTFMMGDEDEVDATPHAVTVSAFFIDKYLVTQWQFQTVMDANPSRWKGDRNPVEQVRWSDAVRFCNRRSELEGLQPCYNLLKWSCDFGASGYRLPTEAEWEYACRAGAKTAYFFGSSASKLGDYAWYEKNAKGRTHPVGEKRPNAWGLYDMCGNVWQWCNDFYQVDYYAQSPAQDPRGPAQGQTKVVRGGAWRFSADNCRAGFRYNENPGYADVCFGFDIYGFRCVRSASPPSTQ